MSNITKIGIQFELKEDNIRLVIILNNIFFMNLRKSARNSLEKPIIVFQIY